MQRLATLALAFAVFLSGCATTGKLQAPKLTIVGAGMTSADVFSQVFRVKIHVDNPNARDLPIKSLKYTLFLEGDSFAEGESEAAFVVPANGSLDFDLPVHTNFMSSIGRLLSRLTGTGRQEIEYVFSGYVVADVAFSPKIKFSQGGLVNLTTK